MSQACVIKADLPRACHNAVKQDFKTPKWHFCYF